MRVSLYIVVTLPLVQHEMVRAHSIQGLACVAPIAKIGCTSCPYVPSLTRAVGGALGDHRQVHYVTPPSSYGSKCEHSMAGCSLFNNSGQSSCSLLTPIILYLFVKEGHTIDSLGMSGTF
jgi:hypothetical protein